MVVKQNNSMCNGQLAWQQDPGGGYRRREHCLAAVSSPSKMFTGLLLPVGGFHQNLSLLVEFFQLPIQVQHRSTLVQGTGDGCLPLAWGVQQLLLLPKANTSYSKFFRGHWTGELLAARGVGFWLHYHFTHPNNLLPSVAQHKVSASYFSSHNQPLAKSINACVARRASCLRLHGDKPWCSLSAL